MQFSEKYYVAALAHQGLRKEIKKPQFNPLPLCFWDSFGAANQTHQSYLSSVKQGTEKAACILHSISLEQANACFWKARSNSFK